ncbi:MAG: DUF1549 and DUF1553 domain-containing protein [Planctomycetia bacterium]|nr:DUF1549 and DUF1553 domain-containing protein [Planctomycetia bacterium]
MYSSPHCARFLGVVLGLAVCAMPQSASAEAEPALHAQIDALVAKRLLDRKITPAEVCSDAEFVRRIYLDLTGIIPTSTQARDFLDDEGGGKRARLIDKLLASPEYALHMARVYDVMLTERRIPTITSYDVPQAAWRAYLTESFAANKPWDRMVQEILGSDGADEKLGSGVKFYLVRDVEPHALTRDVGRLFLGVDLQCAQCHDDPRFDDYRQADYYGLYAFVQRMKLHPMMPRGAQVAETAEGKTTFTSVFTTKSGETFPRLPGGEMLADPMLDKGKEYVVKPGPKDRSVPTYSRRLKLSERLPRQETKGFARNIANRVWAQFFGRGIVHPLDLHHATNPPSHPELLERLEQWMVEHRYDLRGYIRELVLSDTYQRSSLLPNGVKELPDDAFAVALLRGLTAEQLRWSLLQATGHIEMHYAKLAAAVTKASADKKPAVAEPEWKVKHVGNEALERQSASLITAFAGLAGQGEGAFDPVVDQALYLRNSTKLLPLLQSESGTTLERLGAIIDSKSLAGEMYLSVLARRPTSDEIDEVRRILGDAKSPAARREALQALVWGLLSSAEFRLNH